MTSKFDFSSVEKKWQEYWYANNTYEAIDNDESREKKYILVEFPFPSGASLHVGHLFRYTVPDIYSRFLRMRGYNVMFPMGWDAFGLPAEEYARKTGVNPRITTETNIANLKQNILKMGYGVDWNREFATTDPEYYKWTQWIFKKFYEAGLAEQKDVELWWCEALGTVLANEEVYDGPSGEKLSERGDHPVEKKTLKQWVIKITEYGDKLLEGLEKTNFPPHVKAMQKEWIGRSEGVTVDWDLVPQEYINHLNSYPDFSKDDQKDYKSIIRERAAGLIRIKETGEYVSYTQKRYDKSLNFVSGGAIDIEETPQMTFVRETFEELGIKNLSYVCDLGSLNSYEHFKDQLQHTVEHYFLFEVSKEDYENREKAEVDNPAADIFGEVVLGTIEDFRSNNWQQFNLILDNLEEYDREGSIKMVEEQNRDILLATTNQSKIKRYKNFINFNGVNLKSPQELGIEDVQVEETGESEIENAKLKAKAYWERIQEPALGADSGFYIPSIPEDRQPGKRIKVQAGVEEGDSDEVKFEKMTKYFVDLVKEFGTDGELEGYFFDAYALYDGMTYYTSEAKRWVTLTDRINDKDNMAFPMCSIYRAKSCGVYHNQMTDQQEAEFLAPSRLAAYNLVHNFLFDSEQLTPQANSIKTFTTRVDTIPSSTFVIVSPEYEGLLEMVTPEYQLEVANYIETSKNKSERERQINKDKTAVFTGRFVRHPLNNQLLPVWVSDFVLAGYGTGAVMADAHDERDWELAQEYGIYVQENIAPETGKKRENEEFREGGCAIVFDPETQKYAFAEFDDGRVIYFAGGKDENESVKEAVLREVCEESGLCDYKSVSWVGKAHAHFYNQMKKVNRVAIADCFLVVLNSTQTKEIQLEEHETFKLSWKDPQEVLDYWMANNADEDYSHYIRFLKDGVAKCIAKGLDTTSDPNVFHKEPFTGYGVLFDSGKYDGLTSEKAKEVIADDLVAMGKAEKQVNYKFRDWVFSRQRYWGEPFPLEYIEKDNGGVEIRLLDDSELPLVLPDLEDFEPSKDGRSPLAKSDWIKVDAKTTREADTMPNWAGSNWYYLRFCDPKNSEEFASQENLKYWLPVDHYFGGGEHTTMHLLYSRFGHQFLYDQGLVPTDEPYDYRHNGGILLGPDGSKMSKSKGNVIQPDDKLESVGADALRLYVCFIGPYDATVIWQEGGLNRCKKLVDDIWSLRTKVDDGEADQKLKVAYNKMLKKVTEYLENQKNNVAVSELMSFVNYLKEIDSINREIWQNFVLVLAPFAPHLAEELAILEYLNITKKSEKDIDWETLNKDYGSIHLDPWPQYDEALTVDEEVTYAVQVNGKVRGDFQISKDSAEEEILTKAKERVSKWLEGKELKFHKIIPGKLVTLVVK